MRKLFQQIDDLCAHSGSPVRICITLGMDAICVNDDIILVTLAGQRHEMPSATNLRWRRVWRAFLTDHVDDVANSLAAATGVAPGGQPAATA